MADKQVSILKRDGTQSIFYATYTLAIPHAVSGDLIQIWADLNDQIVLKDKVDIWIMPGVVVNNTTTDIETKGPTITDKNIAVDCKIYGMGVIKNSYNDTSTRYECIKILNSNTKLTVECDFVEALGSTSIGFAGVCILIERALKFHLTCKKVCNQNNVALYIGSLSNVGDVNLKINKVETGIFDDFNSGNTAIVTKGDGFISIDEILCRNLGHCLSHRSGTITARIKKMTTVNNRSGNISTVHLNQGDNNQKLILYFDEINNIKGSVNSLAGIEVKQGTGIFIGRRIYSEDTETVIIGNSTTPSGTPQKISVRCNEIICLRKNAITMNNSVQQCFIQANYIEANYFAVLYSDGSGNFVLKNGTLKNKYSSTDAIGIGVDTNLTSITLINVKIISGNETAGRPFNVGNSTQMNVFNYGLFTNAPVNTSLALLKIGTSINYQYVQSSDLT